MNRSKFINDGQYKWYKNNLGKEFKHLKTDKTYTILGLVIREHDLAICVIYRSAEYYDIWCRPFDEFTDGRFERIN